MFRIVNTDNFGGDYPNEKFHGGWFATKQVAQDVADTLNERGGEHNPRYFKVVKMPYTLQPGFQP